MLLQGLLARPRAAAVRDTRKEWTSTKGLNTVKKKEKRA
jgi:hypothetical protein